jgi:Glycosyl hydrolase family 20, catalytic domain
MEGTPRRDFLRTATVGLAGAGVRSAGDTLRGGRRLRGLMADAARLPERVSYYRRLIDFCRDWDLNTLLFRLTDDQGSALRFQSHPELITHVHALTPREARDLAEYGERRGVMLIPEVESFGHTRYITAVPKHTWLEDRGPGDRDGFTGLNPVAPETLGLIADLYREVADAFPSPYLHGGCDEVRWGGSELSRRALRQRGSADIWADYLSSLSEVCRGLGKELIVWGDVVLRKDPSILRRLDRRVIVMDWQYFVTDPRPLARAAVGVIEDGRRMIGAPAIVSCAWGPRPADLALRNIDAFADAYGSIEDARCLGVIVTNWVPSRYLQGALWDSFAYAAVGLAHGSAVARQSAFRTFVERFYGAAWTARWRDIFATAYRGAPARRSCAPAWPSPTLPVPWASDAELRGVVRAGVRPATVYGELRSRLRAVEDSVRLNPTDFAALTLSTDYLEHVFWREAVVKEASRSSLAGVIDAIAERDRVLVDKLDADWNTGRFDDCPGKLGPLPGLEPEDQLLFQMRQAAGFSSRFGQFRRRSSGSA